MGPRRDALNTLMVPVAGLEPASLAAGDFESPASTNSATPALARLALAQCRESVNRSPATDAFIWPDLPRRGIDGTRKA